MAYEKFMSAEKLVERKPARVNLYSGISFPEVVYQLTTDEEIRLFFEDLTAFMKGNLSDACAKMHWLLWTFQGVENGVSQVEVEIKWLKALSTSPNWQIAETQRRRLKVLEQKKFELLKLLAKNL